MVKATGAGTRCGKKSEDRTIVTVPNVITAVRFLVAPLFSYVLLARGNYAFAAALLLFLGTSDWIDGYLARRLNQVTVIGKILDPVADRLSLIIVFATLAVANLVPWFVIVVVGMVDVILAATSLPRLKTISELKVTFIGKIRTALLMAGVLSIMGLLALRMENTVAMPCAYAIFYAGCLGHLWAGIGYFRVMLEKEQRAQAPLPAYRGEVKAHDN